MAGSFVPSMKLISCLTSSLSSRLRGARSRGSKNASDGRDTGFESFKGRMRDMVRSISPKSWFPKRLFLTVEVPTSTTSIEFWSSSTTCGRSWDFVLCYYN